MRTKFSFTALAAGLAAVALPSPASAAPGTCPNPAFQKEAAQALQVYLRDSEISGAVLVAVDGKPALRQGIGLASRELGVANTPLTKFRIGSITKQFTAAAILQLQEAGKLSIDDPISKYYADAPAAWSQVALRNLLNHSSGIPSYTDPGMTAPYQGQLPQTIEGLIRIIRDKPLQYEPGKGFAYDNSGYLILGYVIEKVSGESYAGYLQQHIFGPLGMTGSGYDSASAIIPDRAQGYERGLDDRIWRNTYYVDLNFVASAGALYSTVDDLLKWDEALFSGRVIKPESLQAMTTDYGHKYGFGWYVDPLWDQARFWHGGDISGFMAQNVRYPQAGLDVVVLFNEHLLNEKLAGDLAGLCLGAAVYPQEVAETPENLARYAGYYDRDDVSVLKIEPRDGVLATTNFQQGDTHFYPQGDGKFFAKSFGVSLTFQTGADGQPTGLLLQPPSKNVPPLAYKRIDPAEGERLLGIPVLERMAAQAKRAAEAKAAGDAKAGSPGS